MLARLCLNWKALVPLALVAATIWALAPELLPAALPLLTLAACPLAMVFGLWGLKATGKPARCGCAKESCGPPNG